MFVMVWISVVVISCLVFFFFFFGKTDLLFFSF